MNLDIGQLEFVHIKLRVIILWLEEQTGLEFTGTSLFRIGDLGVHGQLPVRGADLRMRNERIGSVIVREINQEWEYDPGRPHMCCAVLHGEGSSLHVHLQVHLNTRTRTE